MTKFTSFVEIIQERAATSPERVIYQFLEDGETKGGQLTYRDLDTQARAIAATLQSQNAQGKHALLLYPYPAGLEFIAAFMGCLYAGVVAVTDNPPHNQEGFEKLGDRIQSSEAQFFLTTGDYMDTLKQALKQAKGVPAWVKSLHPVLTDQIESHWATQWRETRIVADNIAFLQYTSGSTGIPKGVQVSHGNIMHNVAVIQSCFELKPESRGLFWLPLYHDMGLVGGVLAPLYANGLSFLMSPISFIQKPSRWVQAISDHQINVSGSANFAYDLLCNRVSSKQIETLDLSHWDLAFTGAEPIRLETLKAFETMFKPCGFKPKAFFPCYGMAETTLLITGGKKSAAVQINFIDRESFQHHEVKLVDPSHSNYQSVIGCGSTHSDDEVIIVDPDTCQRRPDLSIGEVWVKGAGVGHGYFRRQDETTRTFRAYLKDDQGNDSEGPYLRTGDFGYLHNQELFITGRLKEMLILWGRNMYPQHLEHTAQNSHPDLQQNGSAAFTLELEGNERLILVLEVKRQAIRRLDLNEMIQAVCRAIAQEHTITAYAIAFVKPSSLPKTTSGKIQRKAAQALFQSPAFTPLHLWKATEETTISDLLEQSLAE